MFTTTVEIPKNYTVHDFTKILGEGTTMDLVRVGIETISAKLSFKSLEAAKDFFMGWYPKEERDFVESNFRHFLVGPFDSAPILH